MKLLIILLMLVTFGLFTLSLLRIRRQVNEPGPVGPFIGAVLAYMVYETLIQTQLPEFNIRVDLFVVILLFALGLVKMITANRRRRQALRAAGPDDNANASSMTGQEALDLAERRATRCLYLGLAGILFFWFPVPSVVAVVTGHVALDQAVRPAQQKLATIGLLVGYATIAIYLVSLAT